MSDSTLSTSLGAGRPRRAELAALLLIVVLGSYLRFDALGLRSLWRDELCTWQVSRMPIGESLTWGPELTKPPLYQFVLRAITADAHPSEAVLRLPAAVFGVLTILAAWWLGRNSGGVWIGVALAGLVAVNPLQIFYSREARPYSLLVLGATVMILLWRRVVIGRRPECVMAFVAAAAFTLYAHYLAGLLLAGCFAWWVLVSARREKSAASVVVVPERRARTVRGSGDPALAILAPNAPVDSETPPPSRLATWRRALAAPRLVPLWGLAAVGALCVPLVYRYLAYKSALFQGLQWIAPATGSLALDVLNQLTVGAQWVFVALVPAVALWVAAALGRVPQPLKYSGGPLYSGRDDVCGWLIVCVLSVWGGLGFVSWVAHPAMVARYAIAAAVPAMLLPLVMAHRLDRRAPVVLMLLFMAASANQWLNREVRPGFREMVAYIQENADPESDSVVLTIDRTVYPGWEESEWLGFEYYPLPGVSINELRLSADNVTPTGEAMNDARGLYLIVLWADEDAIIEAAGRDLAPIVVEEHAYTRLLFEPYRLVRVAPLP